MSGLQRALINGTDRYRTYRQDLGRAILLGLEFLIAGDIIRTVGVAPTLENVFILALIVVIRTFLSMALQLEVEGRWPWQRIVGLAAVGQSMPACCTPILATEDGRSETGGQRDRRQPAKFSWSRRR